MTGARGPGTKLPTTCPRLPFFQAASPLLELRDRSAEATVPATKDAFYQLTKEGKLIPMRDLKRTGSSQMLKWYVQ